MARQNVREHMRPTTGKQVGSYSRRDPRGPKPKTPGAAKPAVLADHQCNMPALLPARPGGTDGSGGLG
jgi:hypothetical protein